MTNTKEIRELIKASGLKYKALAEKLGITAYTLQLKIDNEQEFKSSEISKLCDVLEIKSLEQKDRLFFYSESR